MLHHSMVSPSNLNFNTEEDFIDDTFAVKHADRLKQLAQLKPASFDRNANEIQCRLKQLFAQHYDGPEIEKKPQHVAIHDSPHLHFTPENTALSPNLSPKSILSNDNSPAGAFDSRSSSDNSGFYYKDALANAKQAGHKDFTSMASFMPSTSPRIAPVVDVAADKIEHAFPVEGSTAPFPPQPHNSPIGRAPEARNATANNPNDHLLLPIKQILSILGIPFITAPADAEAQCAFLGENNVVDYVSTEDSDVFLFGKVNVVRHLFSARKTPVLFKASDIAEKLGLDRFRLISFAMLVGCDCTPGLPTIGRVKALLVLKDSIFDSMDNSEDCAQRLKKQFPRYDGGMQSFPEASVIEYFSSPSVNTDLRQFIWEKPNREDFAAFLSARLGLCAPEVTQFLKLAGFI